MGALRANSYGDAKVSFGSPPSSCAEPKGKSPGRGSSPAQALGLIASQRGTTLVSQKAQIARIERGLFAQMP